MRPVQFLAQVMQDVRYGSRMLTRQPATTAIVVLSLALGIGANTVVFSMVNTVLLRALPYPQPESLVAVWFTPPKQPGERALSNGGVCLDLPERSQAVFEHVGCYIGVSGNVSDDDGGKTGPEWLQGEMLTYTATQAIGVKPLMGRWYTADEDKPDVDRVILISHGLWQRHFGGAPDIIGKRIRVADFGGNDSPSTIIGVLPEGFAFANAESDYFMPLRNSARGRRSPVRNRWVVARLQPGVSVAQAQAAMDVLAPGFASDSPMNEGWGIHVQPLAEARFGGVRAPLQILQGTALLVLLIACANVGGLLLAQGMTRQRELAVRTALGSPRWRIVRQLLTESVVLAIVGASVAVLVLWKGIDVLTAWLSAAFPGLSGAGLDIPVLAFTLVVSVATALLFGILPAWQASRLDLVTAFKDGDRATGSRGKLRMRSAFVVMQISMAVVLLTGAGLMMSSLVKLYAVDVGFDPRNLTTFQMNFTGQQFFRSTGRVTPSGSLEFELHPRINAVAADIRERLKALPGVEGVTSIAAAAPLGGGRSYPFTIAGRQPPASEGDTLTAEWYPVTADYFHVLQAPVVRGREFTDSDRAGAVPVALVNETMAKKYWPGEDPIGQRIAVQFFNDVPREIVGVVPDIRQRVDQLDLAAQMYVPYAQLPNIQEGRTAFGLEVMTFVVRSRAEISDWLPAARAATVAADPLHAMSAVLPLDQFVAQQTGGFRQYVVLLGVFSLIALTLAIVGIYGVMSQSVIQRTGEIGIRVAFGARGVDVVGLVLRHGLSVIGIGMAIGLAVALGATRLIAGFLWGVTPTDPLTYAIVLSTMFVVAVVACCLPARRALRVDPLQAIRRD